MVAAVIPPIPKVDFIPMKDFVLVQPLAPGETAGGLYLPEDAEMGPVKALVMAVGPGRVSDFDVTKKYPVDVKVGDIVYVGGSGLPPVEVLLEGKQYLLIRDRDITGWWRKTSR